MLMREEGSQLIEVSEPQCHVGIIDDNADHTNIMCSKRRGIEGVSSAIERNTKDEVTSRESKNVVVPSYIKKHEVGYPQPNPPRKEMQITPSELITNKSTPNNMVMNMANQKGWKRANKTTNDNEGKKER